MARRAIILLLLLLCLALFFRDALLSGLTRLYGDSYDGAIEVSILNHWYNVLVHGAAWNHTGWFAPYPDTLGYNDTYIVPGLFFAIARLGGADPFLAAFASHVAMKAIGFLGMYALLRRGLAIGTLLALAGAALFATANASLLHMYHAQLLAVGLLPWLMLFALRAGSAAIEDRRAALWRNGAAFGLLFGLTALNTFYQIWFFSMFALVFVPVGLIVAGREWRATIWRAIARHWRVLAALALLWALALVPFLLVYLPKFAESGGHDFAREVPHHLPIVSTYLNAGEGNLVWGHILPMQGFRGGEHRFGTPIGLWLLVLASAGWAVARRREARLALAVALSLAVLMVLMTRVGTASSLWRHVYDVVPGASGVRVITRFLLVLLIPMIALAMLALQRWRLRAIVLVPIVAFLLVEQVQLRAPLQLDRAAQRAMLADAGAPPGWCDTFVVVSARAADAPLAAEAQVIARLWGEKAWDKMLRRYRHNVDAMLLASYHHRPTIGGLSSFNPPDWAFEGPDDADYLARVRAYARRHPVGRLCVLDRRRTPHWLPLPPA